MLPLLLGLTTFVSTTLGRLFAIRNRERLHLILGFTAGVLLGVVAFDLLPEIFHLLNATGTAVTIPMVALVIGFLGFHIIEKLTIIHHWPGYRFGRGHEHAADEKVPQVGLMSSLALSAHSFFDGVGIGLAFQVNTSVGLAVALAVIAHDFSDGLNTATLMLAHGNSPRRSLWLLALDATTPILGVASTYLFHLSEQELWSTWACSPASWSISALRISCPKPMRSIHQS